MNKDDIWNLVEKFGTFNTADHRGSGCWLLSPDHMELLVDAISKGAAQSAASAPVADEAESGTLVYARNLAVSLHANHYADVKGWRPLPDVLGLLTQIDNMIAGLVRAPASEAQPVEAAVVTINGKPPTSHSLLEALIDIHDDAQNNPPEHRCYVEGAWPEVLAEARAFLATPLVEAPAGADAARLKVTDEMVNRFLCWKLPADFNPDCGISFMRVYNETSPFGPSTHEPVGTNLLSADQARKMLEHVLQATPASGEAS